MNKKIYDEVLIRFRNQEDLNEFAKLVDNKKISVNPRFVNGKKKFVFRKKKDDVLGEFLNEK